jgi:hypothetical protein
MKLIIAKNAVRNFRRAVVVEEALDFVMEISFQGPVDFNLYFTLSRNWMPITQIP